jgi:hypothetical protein
VTRLTPRRLWTYLGRRLRLRAYFQAPGDGRRRPAIPASVLLWALLLGQLLREVSYAGVEALVRSPARRALAVPRRFGDDALAYFTERLDPGPTRAALAATLRQAKRNKAFEGSGFIGFALDGTGAGRHTAAAPLIPAGMPGPPPGARANYAHPVIMGLCPSMSNPTGRGREAAAGQRLLDGPWPVGRRFGTTSPTASWPRPFPTGRRLASAVAAWNSPRAGAAAQASFAWQPPRLGRARTVSCGTRTFDPWATLHWETVRVRYRRTSPWHCRRGVLADRLPGAAVSSPTVFRLAKSRGGWRIRLKRGKIAHGLNTSATTTPAVADRLASALRADHRALTACATCGAARTGRTPRSSRPVAPAQPGATPPPGYELTRSPGARLSSRTLPPGVPPGQAACLPREPSCPGSLCPPPCDNRAPSAHLPTPDSEASPLLASPLRCRQFRSCCIWPRQIAIQDPTPYI